MKSNSFRSFDTRTDSVILKNTMITSRSYLINGVPQWLYVHQAPQAKGSLLFLHGGPGWSDATLAHLSCRQLRNDFNLIHWDQRGTNRSYFPGLDPNALTLDQIVNDGLEVTRILDTEFGIKKPVLIGQTLFKSMVFHLTWLTN